ncbi:MAG: hypothetical protein INR68_02870 [Methylobacterium mesophilicum]|nr:hypothetical protein [Methylobacterium mesophilicum]
MEPSAWITPAIIAALIAGLVNVAGWFVTYQRERRLEIARREEKVRDYITALRAEIRCHNFRWTEAEAAEHLAAITARIEGASSYTPFVPRDAGNKIYDAIANEIHLLPAEAIDAVVRYYAQTHSVAEMVEDLRSETYDRLDAARKTAIYRDYIGLRMEAGRLAGEAEDALNNWRGAS